VAADELGFGRGWELEMHAAQRSLRDVMGDIGLRDHRLEPMGRKLVLTEAAGEETPYIFPPIEVDDEGALQLGLSKNHSVPRQMELSGGNPASSPWFGARSSRADTKPEPLPIKSRFHV
jgi:hypothetical protein